MIAIRKRRLFFIISLVCSASIAVALILYALQQNINLFYSPSQIVAGSAPENHLIRVGGIVQNKSVHHHGNGLMVTFVLTDNAHNVTVNYTGILPTLFREGQGIVAEGTLNNQGIFIAQQVLAKHDANYMPPDVAETLQKKV